MRSEILRQFVNCGNWFERRYQSHCDARYPTFKAAANLWLQSGGQTIVETGCVRQENDFGAGYSTVLFAEIANQYGGLVWSVDNDLGNLELAAQLTSQFAAHCRFVFGDSVDVLQHQLARQAEFSGRIDLLYLDSYDYPAPQIAKRLGCKNELEVRRKHSDLSDDEIAAHYADLVDPPQRHCLAELHAALPWLHPGSIVLIDDNHWPGGGKPRLAKRRLAELGWYCVLDSQQTLWLPPS